MNRFLKTQFGLTDSGAGAVARAAVIAFFVNIGYMAFMMIAMVFGRDVLDHSVASPWFYLGLLAVTLSVVYILVDLDYVKTFNATYKEACDLRLEIAERIKVIITFFLNYVNPLYFFITGKFSIC